MTPSLLMLDLVRTVYWFDEQLQARLAERGWRRLNRTQSLVLVNLANGESRSSRIAEHLGVSRQAISQLLLEMAQADLIELVPDPADRRARVVRFSPRAHAFRDDAQLILRALEDELQTMAGAGVVDAMRTGLSAFLRSREAVGRTGLTS